MDKSTKTRHQHRQTVRINGSDNDFKLIIYGQHLVTRHRFLFTLAEVAATSLLLLKESSRHKTSGKDDVA